MQLHKHLKQQALSEIENLKVHGRTTGNLSPLTLFWTGSAIEFNAKGSELWLEVETDYEVFEPWIGIVINGVPVSRQMLVAGRHWICLFRGMNPDTVKSVRFVKETQAMSGDPGCCLQIHSVRFDGDFLPVEDKVIKLEFVGDSITSGEGTVGATIEQDWIPMWMSALNNYTAMTADALDAEYRVISQCGWGVLTSWDNNPHANIPDYYEQVCGLLSGPENEALGAFQAHDFTVWQPDVVVINLGTNDASAFHTSEWVDPTTGEIRKQRLNEDGTYRKEDLKSFEDAVSRFLMKLRRYNPEAYLVWAYGMKGIPMLPAIYRGIDTYVQDTGDQRVSVFQLPNTTDKTAGSRAHPGVGAHEQAAKELTEFIRGVLLQNE